METLLQQQNLTALLIGKDGFAALFAFILFTLFGMVWVKIFRYNKKKKAALRATPPEEFVFNMKIWLKDNLLDFVLALMSSYFVYILFPDIFSYINTFFKLPEFSSKLTYGLFLGVFFQYVTHKLLNKVNL